MKKQAKSNQSGILMVLLTVSCLLVGKKIFTDFGIDAGFQVSMSYRLAFGDQLFRDMWEPYQMSAFLCAPLIRLYETAFHTTEGVALFLQICGALMGAAVSGFFYMTLRGERRSSGWTDPASLRALAAALLFWTVTPKDIQLPDYSNMQLWFTMLLLLFLYRYFTKGSPWDLALGAVMLCGTVLSYPSCILFLPLCGFFFFREGKGRGFLLFFAVCALLGLLYLVMIFQNIAPSELLPTIRNMLSLESSHAEPVLHRFGTYGITLLGWMAVLAGIFGCCLSVLRLRGEGSAENALWWTFLAVALLCAGSVFFCPRISRYAYSVSFPVLMILGSRNRKYLTDMEKKLYDMGTLLSLGNFLSTVLLTNLVLIASVPYLLLGASLGLYACFKGLQEENARFTGRIAALSVFGLAVLMHLFFLIRPMNGDVSNILQLRGIVRRGPARGILSEYMGPYMQNSSFAEWEQYIREGDAIFLVGPSLDTLGYLYEDTVISAPSLVPTPGYSDALKEYWKQHPEKYPDVVIASCWYGEMKADLSEESWLGKWMEEEFRPESVVDGKYWRYYFREAR